MYIIIIIHSFIQSMPHFITPHIQQLTRQQQCLMLCHCLCGTVAGVPVRGVGIRNREISMFVNASPHIGFRIALGLSANDRKIELIIY